MTPVTITIEPGKSRTLLLARTDNGIQFSSSFTRAANAKQASERLGVPAEWIDEIVGKYRIDNAETSFTWEPSAQADRPPVEFLLRDLASPDTQAERFETFEDALAAGKLGQVLRWNDRTEVACLDYDWHGTTPPGDVIAYAYQSKPLPSFAWVTRSGGLRLVYKRHGDVAADTIAAVAAFSLVDVIRDKSPELLNNTRIAPGEVLRLAGGCDLGNLRQMFSETECDETLRDEYLDDRGLSLGQRVAHSHCIIDPDRPSNSPTPVLITSEGIRCYSCDAHTGNGFRSWGVILGTTVATPLATVVRNRVHWDHAKYILAEFIPTLGESLREQWYKAALTVYHGPDVDIANVFATRHLVRYDGYWGTPEGEVRREVEATLARLPAVLDDEGKLIPERLDAFKDAPSLSRYGYYAVRRVHGMRTSTRRVRMPGEFRPIVEVYAADNRPQWVEAADRVPVEDAWRTLETVYNGVNRGLVELLAFCKMLVELGGVSMPPMFLFEGVSGSGKSATPQLAAAILGDSCVSVFPNKDDAKTAQGLFRALAQGTFVTFDEVIKSARKFRLEPRSHLDFLLQITPGTLIDVKYIHPVTLPQIPIIVITDTGFDDEVLGDTQFGRRLFYGDLGTERKLWAKHAHAAGLSSIFGVRSVESFRHAVDSLLCHWIDKYFSSPFHGDVARLDDVAETLGIQRLENRAQNDTKAEYMRALFDAWVAYETPTTLAKQRTPAPDYKTFKTEPDASPLASAWAQVHDTGDPMNWSRANERSWQNVLGRANPVRLFTTPTRKGLTTLLSMTFREEVGGVWRGVSI